LLVLLSHAGLPVPGGGIVGVTLFFVLSGFLITALLLAEHHDAGTISLSNFYLRRALRLLPALAAVVAVITAWQVMAGSPDALRQAGAALSYAANWIIISTGEIGPFDHTWSLAVEEQFYLLWPLAVICLIRWPRAMLGLLLVGLVGSVALRAALMAGGASIYRVSNGSDTRAEALLLGCILALLVTRGVRLPGWTAAVAMVGLCAAVVTVGYTAPGLTIGLTIATVLAAVAVAGALETPRWLSWSPLRRVGRVSYGVYLWHWPVIYLFGVPASVLPDVVRIPLLIAASLAIAEGSYRLIESPFLRLKDRGLRAAQFRPALRSAVATAAIVVATVLAISTGALATTDANPMSRGLLLSAGVDVDGLAGDLRGDMTARGWGSGVAWDAFDDGSTNPAATTYSITTAFVIQGFLDQKLADRELAKVAAQWARCCWSDDGFYWYSDEPRDAIYTPNVSAMLAGITYRFVVEHPELFTPAERRLIVDRADAAIVRVASAGLASWSYSSIDNVQNDLMHLGYILWGAEVYREYGGSVPLPWSPDEAVAVMTATEFVGLWPAAGPAMRYAYAKCFAPSLVAPEDLRVLASGPRDEAHRTWAAHVCQGPESVGQR
jgi:peptidoglycan/LPS O-acetylase OafA/YrhL